MCLTELSVRDIRRCRLTYRTRGKLGTTGLHSHSRGKEREKGDVWLAEAYGGVVLGGGVTGVDRSQTTDLKG